MFRDVIEGGLAGLVATGPMTAVMRVGEAYIPTPFGGRLPPRQITEQVLEDAGVRHELDEQQQSAAATAAHYGFGTSAGCLLGVVAGQLPGMSRPALGVAVGLTVWAGSYLGWLPLAGIRRPATEEPKERNAQMVAAHIAWGCVAGVTISVLERLRRRTEHR